MSNPFVKELLEYVAKMAEAEAKSSKEWAEAGNKEQADYRNGMSAAFNYVRDYVEREGHRASS